MTDIIRQGLDNAKALAIVDDASCYHCLRVIRTYAITEYVDDGQTALCPRCGVDALVPGIVDAKTLESARDAAFTGSRLSIND